MPTPCSLPSPFLPQLTSIRHAVRLALAFGACTVLLNEPRCFSADDAAADPAALEFFESRIRPVLVEHCYECHSDAADQAGQQQAGLWLDTRDGLRLGGDSGPTIDLEDPSSSLLLSALRYDSLEMPPSGPLGDRVAADFEQWIEQGAIDPRISADSALNPSNLRLPNKKEIDLESGRNHWAYQPIPMPPTRPANTESHTSTSFPSTTVIDQFISARWPVPQIAPQPSASRIELIRRVTFDLTGLPPTTEAVLQFQRDSSPDAVERLVDSLLASPDFGEQFGRHWLDVARYAESVTLRGLVQHQAWRYRDYTVDSMNRDKPYDQFIREQIAGDLLPSSSLSQTWEQCVATTFLTLGNTNLEEQDKEQLRMDVVDEQLTVIGSAILGQTLGCARCHDHKFDPIPTKDYYALAGIFRNTQVLDDDNVSRWIETPLPLPADELAIYKNAEQQIADLKTNIKAAESDKDEAQRMAHAEQVKVWKADLKAMQDVLQNRPKFMASRERKTIEEGQILIRGNVHNQGAATPRGFLSVLGEPQTPTPMPSDQSGRVQLGEWASSPHNPLVARVWANRLWVWLCGQGLVRTPDNFGTTGQPPTHPELLDYLAGRLIQNQWSTKALVREIVLSDVYQRSSRRRADLDAMDPDNRYWGRALAKPMSAESMLDSIIVFSRDLDQQVGGKLLPDSLQADYGFRIETSRRAIYWPMLRNAIPELMRTFDGANPSMVTGQRNHSIVATQASFMMNHPWVVDRCRLAAQRFLRDNSASDHDRVDQLYWLVLGRAPVAAEMNLLLDYVEADRQIAGDNSSEQQEVRRWGRMMQSLLSTVDFRYCP